MYPIKGIESKLMLEGKGMKFNLMYPIKGIERIVLQLFVKLVDLYVSHKGN